MTRNGQEELAGVFKKFCSPILELGCDSDEVVKDIFEPLVFKMIHWYSAPMQYGKCHTAILLDALFVSFPLLFLIRSDENSRNFK